MDEHKCTGCGDCVAKCPVGKKGNVPDQFEFGLKSRGAIYIPHAQAVPRVAIIDPESCLKLTKGKCGACEKVVPLLNDIEEELNLTFEYINLKEDPSRMYELRIQPFYVPTVIVDCTAYVSKESVWSKEKYKAIITGRASAQ